MLRVCISVVHTCGYHCRVYIVAVIRPYVPTLFLGALILGSAGGGICTTLHVFILRKSLSIVVVLWTAQGQILIQNSSKEKMGTTSGIFWFMLQQRYMYLHVCIQT